jgi:hypothetical protein
MGFRHWPNGNRTSERIRSQTGRKSSHCAIAYTSKAIRASRSASYNSARALSTWLRNTRLAPLSSPQVVVDRRQWAALFQILSQARFFAPCGERSSK